MSSHDEQEPRRRPADQPTEEQFALENLLPDLDPELREALERDSSGAGTGPGEQTAEFDSLAHQALDDLWTESAEGPTPADSNPAGSGSEAEQPAVDETPNPDSPRSIPDPSGASAEIARPEYPPQPPDTASEPEAEPSVPSEEGETEASEPTAEETDPDRTAVMAPVAAAAGGPGGPVTPAPSATPGLPNRPGAEGDPEKPPRRPRIFLSFFLAAILIIGSVAGASSATVLLYLGDIAADLRENSIDVEGVIVEASSGEPQTILLLGSDRRSGETAAENPGLADTAMLLRLDPEGNGIALMSIPRDLKVEIPGYGTDKFNAAYAFGGPKLTVRTVQSLTGLDINHVVNIDFEGFIRVVDEINCLFINVDRRYYHSNVGLSASQQHAEIDIEPGYQKLCGEDSLDYARHRYSDNDFARAARQQEVMREARQRIPISKMISDRDELLKIFTTYTTSDIKDTSQMIEMINLLVDARSASIQEVHFPAVSETFVEGQASYVVAAPEDIQEAVDKFLGFEASGGVRGELDRPEEGQQGRGGPRAQQRQARQARKQRQRERRQEAREQQQAERTEDDGLVDAAEGSRDVAMTAAAQLGPSFPVFYPTRLPSGAIYVQDPRVYHLRDTDKNPHGAFVFVMQLDPQGDYFNLQGIRGWSDPPILGGPHETVRLGGREFKVYYDGDRIRMIAWHVGKNSYWISNSLLQALTNDQMLGMARTVGEVIPERKTRAERITRQLAAQE